MFAELASGFDVGLAAVGLFGFQAGLQENLQAGAAELALLVVGAPLLVEGRGLKCFAAPEVLWLWLVAVVAVLALGVRHPCSHVTKVEYLGTMEF